MIQSGTINVLVVDDSDFFLRITADKLENNHGIRTATASSGGEALSVLEDESIDCIVSDYQMPSMDGLKLYRLVDRRFDLPFILLTGEGDEAVASEAIGAGIDDYLQKDKAGEGDRLDILANRVSNVVRQRQAQEKYELLVDNSPDDIAQVSADGTILAANERMAETYNLTQSGLRGQTLVDILPTQVGRARVNRGRTAIKENRRVTFQDSFEGNHYHNIAVTVSTAAETGSFQLITRDITEQKEREQKLRMRTEELAVINRLVRHDINNDVQLLIGWSEAVAQHVDGPEQEFVDRICDTCDHIAELTGVAREFVESITSDEEFELEPVDLQRIVENEREKKRSAFEDATITVDGSIPPVTVEANGLLSSVFGNLLNNAARHNDSENPTVELSARRRGDRVVVSVADDGPGVPDDQKEEVFGKGEMGPESPGTGIGLYLVHRLVEKYGGRVWVEDNEPQGAVFKVELQIASPTADKRGMA